jgi:Ni2+-binding GTPase involved in maturation of urease and hydrogenase
MKPVRRLVMRLTTVRSAERIMGVETGGCPHTAIREDASMNRMRQPRPFIFSNLKSGEGVEQIARFIVDRGGLHPWCVRAEPVVELIR